MANQMNNTTQSTKSAQSVKKVLVQKGALLAAVAFLAAGLFFVFDVHLYLTLDQLKSHQGDIVRLLHQNPIAVPAAFFVFYVLVTALSLPGAAMLTIAAGAIFGLAWGTLLSSFASTIGATVAFLVSRFLLHDTVQQRFGDRLKAVNRGIKRDGGFYLFTLRLVPAFPFFVINLLMGLTPLRVRTFYWVSQVGMLPGTIVYVNAGTQLASVSEPADILSPSLIISFTLLAIFPWLAKAIASFVRRRRVYGQWKKPKYYDRNLVVIGAGAAGLVTAYIAATVKAKVTLVEAHKMGGDCLNYGCVPSKALIKSARVAQQMRHADRYGLEATEPPLRFGHVFSRITKVIEQVAPHDSVERYSQLGVDVVEGHARIVDPWTVDITKPGGGTLQLTTRSIVIATGARPFVPSLPGLADVGYVTSDTLWERFAQLDHAPHRIVVLGGGPIGCELAQSLARLGSKVIQIERGSRLLKREDEEVSALCQKLLADDGVDVLTDHSAVRCKRDSGRKTIVVEHQGKEVTIEFDELVCAVGRSARLSGYGLEELGIPTDRVVVTDQYLQTLYPNIYAAGDVAGPFQFTHTAAHMAWYAAVNALFGSVKRFKVDYSVIPWTTFVDPEIARVGLNEQEARAQGVAFEVSRFELADMDRAIAEGATQGFIKVLTIPGRDKILGVTLAGEHAGELLAEFVLAMRHGLGLKKILGTIHTYPTFAEANKYAAGEWRKSHKPERLLNWAERYHRWRRG